MAEVIFLSILVLLLWLGLVCFARPKSETARQAYVFIFGGGLIVFGILGPCSLVGATGADKSGLAISSVFLIVGISACICAVASIFWLWSHR